MDEGRANLLSLAETDPVSIKPRSNDKRKGNVENYAYFGEPVYTHSLKEGVNDVSLTSFKVPQIDTTIDEGVFTPDDQVVEGKVEEGRRYTKADVNRTIEIEARERYRVKTIENPNYCVRVTANDGAAWLRILQDNDKTIPTMLTTSQKLSTGVDARNVRHIVLMRPINSMIEIKQIIEALFGKKRKLLQLKYGSPAHAVRELGSVAEIRSTFHGFQRGLFQE